MNDGRLSNAWSGESGITPIPYAQYYKECDPEFMSTFFCSYYGVEEPTLKENPSPSNSAQFRGSYYYVGKNKGLLTYNRRMTGLIIHELAHHVVHATGRNGHGHHNPQFWSVLQEMHDLWR